MVTGPVSRYQQLFVQQLERFGLTWCRGCDHVRTSHKRGFILGNDRTTVHFDSNIVTRKALYGGFHEIGHTQDPILNRSRRWEEELFAEAFARVLMREVGVPIPRDEVRRGAAYVARKKRTGDRIIAARNR